MRWKECEEIMEQYIRYWLEDSVIDMSEVDISELADNLAQGIHIRVIQLEPDKPEDIGKVTIHE